ncbi:hypothetical protein [Halomonas heilongjiangensis]|uniref:Uncharacterized protein n=1 Tax=Halomonas heilongjiangensis TaxID=1387883 RepID=A0A2N7TP27_9GAMM|nr:hypothetical protein [Halomonas heilongjiangensis]PMR69929.1 hypothetical protein C1H66_08705 [Halomonas heilongjiangensis]PXX94088.1 hypothetical protein CR158_01895 [Halomonas heilongjiangensis]
MNEKLHIVAKDEQSRSALLVGWNALLLPMVIAYGVPVFVCAALVTQLMLDIPLWPLNNFNLMLGIWGLGWLAYLGWTGLHGLHHHLYWFAPDERQLLYLNTGEIVDLDDEEALQEESSGNIQWHLPGSRSALASMDWRHLNEFEVHHVPSLKEAMTREVDWGGALMILGIIEAVLIFILLASDSAAGFFLSQLWILATWLVIRLIGYWFERQLPTRAAAVARAVSIENGMRYEA